MPTKRNQRPTSIYLRPGDEVLLAALSTHLGEGRTQTMRHALWIACRWYGLLDESKTPDEAASQLARAGEATGQEERG